MAAGTFLPQFPFSVSQAYAAEGTSVEGAKNFVSGVAKNGIGFLEDKGISEEQRVERFRNLLKTSFDMNTIGRFALGTYWKSASEKQRQEYLNLFQKMIVEVYSRRFGDYNGQKVEVRSARAEGASDVIVNSFIVSSGSPEVQVDWRIRQKNGTYKVIDVIVEGVSMALTQRSDFASVIQRGGGDINVLLEHLRQ